MSAKEAGKHSHKKKKLFRRICYGLIIFNVIILFIILVVWLILRPTKPRFTLQDATIYQFNVTQPSLLTSNFQVTIASRNPNEKIGIYYDRLSIFASYNNQQITMPTVISPIYQGHKDINIWSPFLNGNFIPVAPYLAAGLSQDQAAGSVMVNIKIDGRVRWKIGTWVSGRYHLYVNCPAYITFGSRSTGIAVGNAVKYQLLQRCSVDI